MSTVDVAHGEQGTLEVVDERDTWVKPIPEVDPLSEVYFKAAAEGTLLIQRCPACSHRQHYPRLVCTRCGNSPDWEAASGRGQIYTFTVIRQAGMPGFRDEVPYVIALVDLEEGPRLMGNLPGCDPDDVRIGMPVEAFQVRITDDIAMVQWRLVAEVV
jgi:uncharacterized protein